MAMPPPFDGFIEVTKRVSPTCLIVFERNRYSVPGELAGRRVTIRLSLDDSLRILDSETLVAQHQLRPASQGWVTVADHHTRLWQETLQVQQRPLAVYEEVV